MKQSTLSLIIPVYNEATRITNMHAICRFFSTSAYPVEIIVVDDGSIDDTQSKLQRIQKKLKFKYFSSGVHLGKGGAIALGVARASGDWIGFMDVDLSVPLVYVNRFMSVRHTSDILIATRRHKDSRVLVHQSFLREYFGQVFTSISRLILGLPVTDVTCGLKLYKQKHAHVLFQALTVYGWAFDAEILYRARKMGMRIMEIPVDWSDVPHSKVRLITDAIQSIRDIVKIRFDNNL